jgi:hypothetical protein
MAWLHAVVVSFLDLLRCGIWHLKTGKNYNLYVFYSTFSDTYNKLPPVHSVLLLPNHLKLLPRWYRAILHRSRFRVRRNMTAYFSTSTKLYKLQNLGSPTC